MKNKLLIILTIILLFSLTSAFATLDDATGYWTFDDVDLSGSNPLDISGNSNDGSNNGATTGVSGYWNQAFDFDGSSDYVDLTTNYNYANAQSASYCFVLKTTETSYQPLMGTMTSANKGMGLDLIGGKLQVTYLTSGSNFFRQVSTTSINTGNYVDICVTYDGSNSNSGIKIYIEGSADTMIPSGSGTVGTLPSANTFRVGNRIGRGEYLDGIIDELAIYDREITSGEVSSRNSASQNPYVVPDVPDDTLFVDVSDIDSGLNVNNVTVWWNGSSYSNTTGNVVSINISAEGGNINLTQNFTVGSLNYSNVSVTNWNLTNTYLANLTGDPLEDFTLLTPNNTIVNTDLYNITWTEAVSPTGKTVTYTTIFYYEGNLTQFYTNSTTNLYQEVDLTNFPSNNFTVVVNATEQYTDLSFEHNLTLAVDRPNYLYFYNEDTQDPIENGDLTVYFPNSDSINLTTDSLGKVNFSSYQNNILQNGSYNITLRELNGFVTPITFFRNYTSLPVNVSFNITVTNINISLFYRSNFTTFDRNATVIIEGVTNQTVNNGSVYIQNASISPATYRITVFADGFFNEIKEFTFTAQNEVNVDIYLLELNETSSGTVTIRTIDEFSRLLENAEVNLLEYDSNTLSYIEVSECFTDSNGECKFIIETNTKSYKFTATRSVNGRTITASTNPQIFSDSIVGGEVVVFSEETLTLTLSASDLFVVSPLQNLAYSITPYADSFNNVTNESNIAVTFNTLDGQSITICVEYFSLVGGVKTSLTDDTFCASASSGSVTESAFFTLNTSKDYLADIYIKSGTNKFILDSYRYYSNTSFLERLENNAMLPYFVVFVWIFLLGGSLMLKNVSLTGVAIVIGAWAIWFFFPSGLIVSVAVLQTVLGINLVYLGRKKEDFG